MVVIKGDPISIGLLLSYSGVVAFFPLLRYVIGLKHWKDFSVVALGLSLYLWILPFGKSWDTGIITWFIGFVISMLASTYIRKILYKRNLHFFSKLALASQTSLLFLIVYLSVLSKFFRVIVNSGILFGIASILLLMATETLVYLQIKKGMVEALRRTLISFISAIFVGFIFRWRTLLNFLYWHQEFFIIFVSLTVIISTWRYLNISDFVRFFKILEKRE